MGNNFIFKVCMPVQYRSPDNTIGFSDKLEPTLKGINFRIDTEELQLPNVDIVAKYYPLADDSHLPTIIKSYFNIENMIYDMHGLKLLEDHFDCPEHWAYSCLEFSCNFSVSEDFIKTYISNNIEEDEDNIVWEIDNYDEEAGKIKIRFGATDIFTEILYSNISTLLSLMNLSRPNSIRAPCIFIDRYYMSNKLQSTVPDVKVFKLTDIPQFMESYLCSSHSMAKFWSTLLEIPLIKIWSWYNNLKEHSKCHNSNVMRALERYFLLFTTNHISELLLLSVAALEALYVLPFTNTPKTQREPSKQNQLISNIFVFLDVNKHLPIGNFEKMIKRIYDQRSRISHGDTSIPNPFRKSLNNDQMIKQAVEESLFLLICSLRKICELNLMELPILKK